MGSDLGRSKKRRASPLQLVGAVLIGLFLGSHMCANSMPSARSPAPAAAALGAAAAPVNPAASQAAVEASSRMEAEMQLLEQKLKALQKQRYAQPPATLPPAAAAAAAAAAAPAANKPAPGGGSNVSPVRLPAGALAAVAAGKVVLPQKPRPEPTRPPAPAIAAAAAASPASPAAAAMTAAQKARSDRVVAAMRHTWTGYERYAFGADELLPQSGQKRDNWSGLGMTLLDGLDTLWIMGLRDEFERGRKWVESTLGNKIRAVKGDISVFETTIRAVGGLLSAHALSGSAVFAQRAKELVDKMLPAFNTPSGIPQARVNLQTGDHFNYNWAQGAILAEFGSL